MELNMAGGIAIVPAGIVQGQIGHPFGYRPVRPHSADFGKPFGPAFGLANLSRSCRQSDRRSLDSAASSCRRRTTSDDFSAR
jgi:hypothetical protein